MKTRSSAQIRSHAQKYIIKLCKKFNVQDNKHLKSFKNIKKKLNSDFMGENFNFSEQLKADSSDLSGLNMEQIEEMILGIFKSNSGGARKLLPVNIDDLNFGFEDFPDEKKSGNKVFETVKEPKRGKKSLGKHSNNHIGGNFQTGKHGETAKFNNQFGVTDEQLQMLLLGSNPYNTGYDQLLNVMNMGGKPDSMGGLSSNLGINNNLLNLLLGGGDLNMSNEEMLTALMKIKNDESMFSGANLDNNILSNMLLGLLSSQVGENDSGISQNATNNSMNNMNKEALNNNLNSNFNNLNSLKSLPPLDENIFQQIISTIPPEYNSALNPSMNNGSLNPISNPNPNNNANQENSQGSNKNLHSLLNMNILGGEEDMLSDTNKLQSLQQFSEMLKLFGSGGDLPADLFSANPNGEGIQNNLAAENNKQNNQDFKNQDEIQNNQNPFGKQKIENENFHISNHTLSANSQNGEVNSNLNTNKNNYPPKPNENLLSDDGSMNILMNLFNAPGNPLNNNQNQLDYGNIFQLFDSNNNNCQVGFGAGMASTPSANPIASASKSVNFTPGQNISNLNGPNVNTSKRSSAGPADNVEEDTNKKKSIFNNNTLNSNQINSMNTTFVDPLLGFMNQYLIQQNKNSANNKPNLPNMPNMPNILNLHNLPNMSNLQLPGIDPFLINNFNTMDFYNIDPNMIGNSSNLGGNNGFGMGDNTNPGNNYKSN